jgi:hypothetical protein
VFFKISGDREDSNQSKRGTDFWGQRHFLLFVFDCFLKCVLKVLEDSKNIKYPFGPGIVEGKGHLVILDCFHWWVTSGGGCNVLLIKVNKQQQYEPKSNYIKQ